MTRIHNPFPNREWAYNNIKEKDKLILIISFLW